MPKTEFYVSIPIDHEEKVCCDALLYHSCSLEFATGVFFVRDDRLYWPTNYTSRLQDALRDLNSYTEEPFTARRLKHKVDRASNGS